jgi:predicted amino acid dehydrogenase
MKKGSELMQQEQASSTYVLMEFLHLFISTDLSSLAAALRPLVGADFKFQQDNSVECMISSWDENEVIIAHPLDNSNQVLEEDKQHTEHNASTYITLAVKKTRKKKVELSSYQTKYADLVARTLANTFNTEVLHSKTWDLDQAKTTVWNRSYTKDSTLIDNPNPVTFASGWKRDALVTTIEMLRPKYVGSLDFLFVIHPITVNDKRRPFPLMRGLPDNIAAILQPTCTILGPIEFPIGDRLLRGELVSIPHGPEEMLERLPEARDAVIKILDYAKHRNTGIVGLGALIPSLTRHGRILRQARPEVSISTGHGFTALTIARMVEDVENEIGGDGVVAVIGAAGSTGRAALQCMFRRSPKRKILAVDVSLQLEKIPRIPGWNPKIHKLTCLKEEIKSASIVVCVTNATGSILEADDLGPNTVVLDDARPENVDQSILKTRPDIRIVKCLARIPGLYCPFEMGIFTPENRDEEVTFTCLAETIMLAAECQTDSYVVGDPTNDQIDYLEQLADRHRVTAANFFSFPNIGLINLQVNELDTYRK